MKRIFFYSLFILNTIIIVAFWWLGSGMLFSSVPGAFIAVGRLLGLIAEFLILVQLVLISRITPVERAYGFDILNGLHRKLGLYIAGLIIFHPILLVTGYAMENQVSLWSQFITFLTTWQDVFKAFLGLLLLLAIVGISITIIRRKLKYETWYATHIFIYVAIFLFFGHQVNTADVSHGIAFYYWYVINFGVFGLLILYRFIRPFWLIFKYRFRVESVVKETSDVYSVYITGRNIEKFRFEPGQFAKMTFFAKGMWYESHPFSFSMAPNGRSVRFSIKALGDFTAKIGTLKPGTAVLIDGPLGIFVKRSAKHRGKESFLLIAGGIGITPIRALAEELSSEKSDVVLVYGARTRQDMAFYDELKKMPISLHGVLSNESAPGFENGFIDVEKISRLVPDFLERETYICGPHIMRQKLVKELEKLGVPKRHVHFEEFAF